MAVLQQRLVFLESTTTLDSLVSFLTVLLAVNQGNSVKTHVIQGFWSRNHPCRIGLESICLTMVGTIQFSGIFGISLGFFQKSKGMSAPFSCEAKLVDSLFDNLRRCGYDRPTPARCQDCQKRFFFTHFLFSNVEFLEILVL